MTGLTALKVVELESEAYHNAELTEQVLVKGKPGYAAPVLGWQAHIVYPGLQNFVQSLKESRNAGLEYFPGKGQTLYERLTQDKFKEQVFQDAMSALSSQANSFLPQVISLSEYKHVVDAGGGDGTNALALARAFSEVRFSVFDSPSVCAIAQKKISEAGLSDRVRIWEGDFFTGPFPEDVDCVLFSHILTIFSMDRNTALLKRVHASLPEGGAVIVFNMMGNDDESGPLSTALGSPYFLAIATGEGMLHPWKDYESALREAGFSEIRRVSDNLPLAHGILVARK